MDVADNATACASRFASSSSNMLEVTVAAKIAP
jgi:hypothetical protein